MLDPGKGIVPPTFHALTRAKARSSNFESTDEKAWIWRTGRAANASAIPRPMPQVPPLITTTVPANSFSLVIFVSMCVVPTRHVT